MKCRLFLLILAFGVQLHGACCPVSMQVDLLYLTTCSEGYFIAVERTGSAVIDFSTLSVMGADFSKRIKLPDTASDPGFRLGINYDSDCPCWSGSVKWWHHHTDTGESYRSDNSDVPTFIPFTAQRLAADAFAYSPGGNVSSSSLYGSHVKGNWDLSLDTLDFQLGSSTIHCPFQFDPKLLLRFAHIEQTLRIKAEGKISRGFNFFNPTDTSFIADFSSKEHLKLCYAAIGPGLGFSADWEWCGGLGLYTDFGMALLYGEKESQASADLQRGAFLDIESLTLKEKRKGSYWCSRPVVDLSVGLRFFCGIDCFQFEAKLGWELHTFFNQGMGELDPPLQIYLSREDNELTLQGLQAAIAFHF